MYFGLDKHAAVDAGQLRKSVLAKQVGQFLYKKSISGDRSNVAAQPASDIAPVLDLARMLARDVTEQVRAVLAFELRQCDNITKDIAERLAKDVEDVSVPFLRETTVFDDAEMADLVMVLAEYGKNAVACRQKIGPKSAAAIALTGAKQSVTSLLRNNGADLRRATFEKITDRFADDTPLLDKLVARSNVPVALVERLVDLVSDAGRLAITERYGMDKRVLLSLDNRARMDQLFARLSTASADQLRAYMTDLKAQKKLDADFVSQALRRRDLRTFEVAIAVAVGDVVATARETIRHGGRRARLRMLERVGFSRAMLPQIARDVDEVYRINMQL